MKRIVALALAAALLSAGARAQNGDGGQIDGVTARALVQKVLELVESKAVPPLDQADYDVARKRLLALAPADASSVERPAVYAAIRKLLNTLDSDRHSFFWSDQAINDYKGYGASVAAKMVTVETIDTPAGRALLVLPPPITDGTPEAVTAYVDTLLQQVASEPGLAETCALVVDLTMQTGGNAWPPMVALAPLFTVENQARFVPAHGERWPLANLQSIANLAQKSVKARANPLEKFRGQDFAVILGSSTASAGEMVAIALRGESGRSRSFGLATAGKTTANNVFDTPDHGHLVLTTALYAHGQQPPLRGKLVPDEAALGGESLASVRARAAAWATAHATACRR